jgi:serine/threonine protein kinase
MRTLRRVNAGPYDFLAPPQSPGELGRLGPYRVLKVLGAGGMGIVFQAEDPQLQRLLALKVMKPSLAISGDARERFLREARAAAAIDHDHIVTIYHVGEDRGVPFLAMPLLRGESLEARLLRCGKPTLAETLRIGRETAEALAAAHERGLIHRDIKPSNLWLEGERGRVKVVDFGLARAAGSPTRLTQVGAVLGTPQYMAPEQAAGTGVDCRCDLFSLGCVLYRLCTDRLPFRGGDMLSMLSALALEQPRPPRQLDPSVPAALSDLILRLLAKNAADPGKPHTLSRSSTATPANAWCSPCAVSMAVTHLPIERPPRSRWSWIARTVRIGPKLKVSSRAVCIPTSSWKSGTRSG